MLTITKTVTTVLVIISILIILMKTNNIHGDEVTLMCKRPEGEMRIREATAVKYASSNYMLFLHRKGSATPHSQVLYICHNKLRSS